MRTSRDPAAVRAGHRAAHSDERRAQQQDSSRPSAATRVAALEQFATETRATPDQYDRNWRLALGTLGGGNHFIELAEDERRRRVADAAFRLARRRQQDRQPLHQGRAGALRARSGHTARSRPGVSPEDHPAFDAYLRDLHWAQQFALHNRNEMMDRVLRGGQPRGIRRGRPAARARAAADQLPPQLHPPGRAFRAASCG